MAERTRNPVPLIVAVVLGLALVLGVRACAAGDNGSSAATSSGGTGGNSASCTQVAVAASSEKAALLKTLAADYNGAGRSVDGTCVQVTVTSKASGGGEQALARGWDVATDGPRPDVWAPASSSWPVLLRQDLSAKDRPDLVGDGALPTIAQTPLVLAMPRPMAQALGWPTKQLGWADLLALTKNPQGWGAVGHPEWGRFKLGKTNPHYSTSGLNATIAAYFAATGRSSDLSAQDVANPKVRAFVKAIESGVVHYGDTTLTFLSNLYRADQEGKGLTYVSAVTVEEKSVWDYNQGNPSGDPATLGKSAKPRVPLVAFYPKDGTLVSDNPYVVLHADWVTDAKRKAALDFLDWVKRPEAQQRFQQLAFRSYDGKPGSVLTVDNGVLPAGAPVVLTPPAPAVLAQVEQSWDSLRKRARVLVIMDVSGSMAQSVPNADGKSRLDLAKDAAMQAISGFAPDDEVGLWLFSTELGDNNVPWVQSVPLGPASSTVPRMKSTITGLVPGGGTALYATLRAAHDLMTRSLDTDRINAIVLLTDGRNEYPPDTDLPGLLRQLGGESLDTSVRVFPIGYGADADTAALMQIAQASQAAFYDASDPASIGKVLTSVLSNF